MSIDICQELSQNFIDFSYEANSERAFPDVRDGLKPVQRASLWEMYVRGYNSSKPHVKSAKITGGIIGMWSPHGDQATYETFARMSQDWINNIPEVDFHGANGNIVISGAPASSRYTEARLAKASEDGLFVSMNKNPVPMKLNFSEDAELPEVLPAVFPRLLINGAQGIGSTIANWWELNNLNEITDAIVKYIKTSTIDYASIYPDFPSGGIIINKDELHEIYETGKGKIVLRGTVEMTDTTITITELPYQVYVEPFISEIKTLIEKDQITGIDDIYNKSDDHGIKIELVCSKPTAKILKQLYKNTSLEKTFSPNHMALLGKTPKMFTLSQYFDEYIKHNITCIINEYNFDLKENSKRLEIVQGLVKALNNIDKVIEIIKKASSSASAQQDLIDNFSFTENQAKAIIDMRLGRLAHLELKELQDELTNLNATISNIETVLASEEEQKNIFINRLLNFTKKYGFKRHTKVIQYVSTDEPEEEEAAIEPEKCVVIMTASGYIKRIPGELFKPSKRSIKSPDDVIAAVIRTNTVDNLMVFTTKGKIYKLPVMDIPEGAASTKGILVKLLTSMDLDEYPSTIYSVYKDTDAEYIVFITQKGMIKKSKLSIYSGVRKGKGVPAISLIGDDKIVTALLMKEEQLIIATKNGKALWCETKDINTTGKTARGIKGFKPEEHDIVVSAIAVRDATDKLAIFTTKGYGKRIALSELGLKNPGGKGQMIHKPTEKTGYISDIQLVANDDILLLAGDTSSLCIESKDIPESKKTAMGNLIIADNSIIKISKI